MFNVDQYENLPEDYAAVKTLPLPNTILPQAEARVAATGSDFRIGGDRTFFAPALDHVQLPLPGAHFEKINWHQSVLHEICHWSGSEKRLARDFSGAFNKAYAREELVAEMGAAFTCATLRLHRLLIEVLYEDSRAIVSAALQASKDSDFLLGFLIGAAEQGVQDDGPDGGDVAADSARC